MLLKLKGLQLDSSIIILVDLIFYTMIVFLTVEMEVNSNSNRMQTQITFIKNY